MQIKEFTMFISIFILMLVFIAIPSIFWKQIAPYLTDEFKQTYGYDLQRNSAILTGIFVFEFFILYIINENSFKQLSPFNINNPYIHIINFLMVLHYIYKTIKKKRFSSDLKYLRNIKSEEKYPKAILHYHKKNLLNKAKFLEFKLNLLAKFSPIPIAVLILPILSKITKNFLNMKFSTSNDFMTLIIVLFLIGYGYAILNCLQERRYQDILIDDIDFQLLLINDKVKKQSHPDSNLIN